MPHCPPDQLADAALGETLPEADAVHLAGCAQCRSEVDRLRRAVDVLTVPTLAAPGAAATPPPGVWDAIAAPAVVTVAPRTPEADTPVDPSDPPRFAAPGPRRRWLAVAASLLAGVGAGAGAVAITTNPDAGGTVVARTALAPLPGDRASGSATVREDGGTRVLRVDLDAPRLDEAYYEVWLMETDGQRMVPVGVLHTGDTELPLPAGLDLAAYPVVDVSVEPQDGQPTHSGISVARGRLGS